MPKVKINDVEIEVAAGTNMIDAAQQAGVEIPHYCYHPHLSIAGNCRMCTVETETPRGPVLEIACNMQARDGLAIRTDSERVAQVRKSVMEFLLVNHPLDCPICDQSGECRLQDYYMDHARHDSRGVEPKVSKRKRQDIGEQILLDAERCVQCSRCVRFGDEVTHTGELRLMNRGDHTEIGIFPGERLNHDYQGNLADICPVGALTAKDFRFERRVWYLKETDGVCTGCSTGCNISVCHQQGEVFRYLPRRNDEVNKSWMCDPGRLRHHEVGGLERLLKARVNGQPGDGVKAAVASIKAAGAPKVALVLGTRASNEANWALAQLGKALGARLYWVAGNDAGAIEKSDSFLMDPDKNPNTLGCRLLAEQAGAGDGDALKAALPELAVVLALEDDLVTRLGQAIPGLVALAAKESPTTKAAAVVIPVAHPVEMDCTYTNKQGRVQRNRRATNPLGDAAPAYAVVDRLAAALGKSLGTQMPVVTFLALSRAVPRMNGLDYKSLGPGGKLLAPAPAAALGGEAK
ncbi:MAG: (2Fe-2S)-binding protein [Deltaproteobacteria bacterium]|nr:(2Fe-2S)-binding protein [Deltaproteobacteria bacterium]